MKHKAIIVDDERLARKEMRSLLADLDQLVVVGEAENLSEAVALIVTERPHTVFLDIQLSNESGFDLLDRIPRDLNVIFVTAYDEYAIRAFEVNAVDYLLKPVNPARLANSVERLLENKKKRSELALAKLEYEDRIFLEIGERFCFLKISSIKYIASYGDYTNIFLDDGRKHMVAKALKNWEDRLPEKQFVRIHRSVVVNIEYIEKVERWFDRSYQIYLREVKEPFTVSRRYAAQMKMKFN